MSGDGVCFSNKSGQNRVHRNKDPRVRPISKMLYFRGKQRLDLGSDRYPFSTYVEYPIDTTHAPSKSGHRAETIYLDIRCRWGHTKIQLKSAANYRCDGSTKIGIHWRVSGDVVSISSLKVKGVERYHQHIPYRRDESLLRRRK